MKLALVALALALAALVLGCKSEEDEEETGHAWVFRCVDGHIRGAEVPLSKVDTIEAYETCADDTCVPEGQACPAPPPVTDEPEEPSERDEAVDVTAPDRRCTSDADCVGMYELSASRDRCCHSCRTIAVATDWAPRARRQCGMIGGRGCPMKKCVALMPVACVSGTCQVQPAADSAE